MALIFGSFSENGFTPDGKLSQSGIADGPFVENPSPVPEKRSDVHGMAVIDTRMRTYACYTTTMYVILNMWNVGCSNIVYIPFELNVRIRDADLNAKSKLAMAISLYIENGFVHNETVDVGPIYAPYANAGYSPQQFVEYVYMTIKRMF
jgi:hypothetical protein